MSFFKKLMRDIFTLNGDKISLSRIMLLIVFGTILYQGLTAMAVTGGLITIFGSLLAYSFLDKTRDNTAQFAEKSLEQVNTKIID